MSHESDSFETQLHDWKSAGDYYDRCHSLESASDWSDACGNGDDDGGDGDDVCANAVPPKYLRARRLEYYPYVVG